MKNNFIPTNNKAIESLNIDYNELSELEQEIENGVSSQEFEITAFKVEQKITNITNTNALNIGGFVNGDSNIKNLEVRYLLTLYSNQFKIINHGDGGIIRKRYGYGYGFTLDVNDIDTNINVNFGVIAASAALNKAKVNYNVNLYGTITAQLAKYLPKNKGDFDIESFKELQRFIKEAKSELKTINIDKLYPIEVLNSSYKELENSDTKSIYYGVIKIKEGLNLKEAILSARKLKTFIINENVIQFMYTYFGINDPFSNPNSNQSQNARRWIKGSYNKKSDNDINSTSWVDIDPATDNNGNFIVFANTSLSEQYKPHPKPENWTTLPKLMRDEFSQVSLDFSSSLKVASTVDVSGKFNSVTINRTIALSIDASDNGFEGSQVIETRYGVGLRLKIKISNIAIGTEINYNVVGAASEMGHANVEYEISGIGISDTTFLSELPGPINISQNSMLTINKIFNKLKKKLAEIDVADLTPQPYSIKVNEPEKIDPTIKSQSVVYAIGKVAERIRLGDAINDGVTLGIKKEDIIDAYKNIFEITDLNERISREDRREARDWLLMKDEN